MTSPCPNHADMAKDVRALFKKMDQLTRVTYQNTATAKALGVQLADLIENLKPLAGNGKPAITARMLLAEEKILRLEGAGKRRVGAVLQVVTGLVLAGLTAAVAALWRTGGAP